MFFVKFWSGSFFDSSRRGRPPKQGLGDLSSYDDFTDDDAIQAKKYRLDDKRSPTPSRDENNGEFVLFDTQHIYASELGHVNLALSLY